ncbi:hypothetical protein AaE_015827 [Aphanomyces astaci]|uniref:DDE Tnp4 domain-containing protein n=1 Tax=Aphanomyces astaci TaxID=112090 RepID=A0A6A4YYC9_APHAT|nr:hypothetical protein AaE_015827 [Aphanomyces astaci]
MTALRVRRQLKERNCIKAISLFKDQAHSPWYTMYQARNTESFISTVSVTPDAFDHILAHFKHEYVVLSRPGRSARPSRIPKKHAVLAMVLHYYTAAVEGKTMQELFSLTPSTFARVLGRAEDALWRTLKSIPDASIRWPSKLKQAYWASKLNAREPLVHGVFAFVDGRNLRVQEPSNADLQNAHYNGWLHCVIVTGVLCYGLDGTLIWGRHNCPGSWNDGEMSRRLQDILSDDSKVGPGMFIASDSAFPVGGRCAALQTMSDCITPLRQAAELGMGSATKVYRQLLLPLPYNPTLRGMRLDNIFRLYNYRVRRCGISQIKNVFGV